MRISLCMIVKNEEAVLARCLDSVKDAVDEIVIVDTGSTDGTAAIARRYTQRVLPFAWTQDFAAARNFSFEQAQGDYLLWLDADDVIPPDMLPRFRALRARIEGENADMVLCKYVNGDCAYLRERIVRNSSSLRWRGRVHECIVPFGRRIVSDAQVVHLGSGKVRGARNLHIYEAWRAEETLGGRDLFYYGRELFYNRLFREAAAVLGEMLAGEGWYVNKIEACRVLAECRLALGEREEALKALLSSFAYGLPRGGVCHAIGRIMQDAGRLYEAIFWYERALACPDRSDEGDFDVKDERTLFPLLGLTFCHEALGQRAQALACHARAAALAPEHPSVVHNAAFFRAQGTQ